MILVLLIIATALKNHNFITPENLQNTSRLIGIYGIFSVGLGVVIISGGIDLSVGSVFAFLGVILSILLVDKQMNPVLAILIIVAAASIMGWEVGFSLPGCACAAFHRHT